MSQIEGQSFTVIKKRNWQKQQKTLSNSLDRVPIWSQLPESNRRPAHYE